MLVIIFFVFYPVKFYRFYHNNIIFLPPHSPLKIFKSLDSLASRVPGLLIDAEQRYCSGVSPPVECIMELLQELGVVSEEIKNGITAEEDLAVSKRRLISLQEKQIRSKDLQI